MSGGTVFPQARVLMPNGDFSQPWRMFMQNLYQATNGGSSQIAASTVSFVPVGTVSVEDVQSAIAQLDTLKVPNTRTVNGHNLGADVTVTASDVGAPSGSGTSTGTNTGDQTITLSGDASGSGTAGVAVTVSKIGGKAASLAGSLTTAGAFASTFTMTGVTAVTFPTSGTLATLAGTEALTNKTLTAPVINNPTGTMELSSGTFGYAVGNGGTVTQATSKTTAVTLNKPSGEITMNAAALASGAVAAFALNNSVIGATDMMIVDVVGGVSSVSNYDTKGICNAGAGVAAIVVKNVTAASQSEAVVLRFIVIKAATT